MLCVGLGQNHQAATPYLKQLDLEVELPDENLEYSKNLCELDVALILGPELGSNKNLVHGMEWKKRPETLHLGGGFIDVLFSSTWTPWGSDPICLTLYKWVETTS